MEFPESAVYRSFDPIEHFRLRVSIEKLSDKHGSLLEGNTGREINHNIQFSRSKIIQPRIALMKQVLKRGQSKSIGNKRSTVQSIFNVLIPCREIVKYSSAVDWPDDFSRMHHAKVMSMPPKKRAKAFEIVDSFATKEDSNSMHIFTNIDGDEYVPAPEDPTELSQLASRIDSWRVYNSAIKQREGSDCVVDYPLHLEQSMLDNSYIEMNIMVYLPESAYVRYP
jgi:hypothetical protein